MKKLISIALAALMLAAMSTTAFAANITPSTAGGSASTAIGYSVNPSYTVTIPDTVTLGQKAIISASNVVLAYDQFLEVKLTGTSGTANAFTVTNVDDTLTYTVEKAGTAVAINDTVLEVEPYTASQGSVELDFSAPSGTAKYSGDYTGTVTFTVGVVTSI